MEKIKYGYCYHQTTPEVRVPLLPWYQNKSLAFFYLAFQILQNNLNVKFHRSCHKRFVIIYRQREKKFWKKIHKEQPTKLMQSSKNLGKSVCFMIKKTLIFSYSNWQTFI